MQFVTELQIHSKLSHSNIVGFYRAFSFQTSTYVVLELCNNGSLADMLKKRKYLTLPEIRRFVIQICGAVKYLHHRHIVHRDLKTGNLFLDENMNVKVGDFGLAALLVTEKEMEVKRRTTMCGTPNYLAPEILEKGKGHDEKVDLWAIGVIAYTLAVGKAPFHASTKEEIYKKLKSGTYAWPELSATTNQSSDLRNLVSSLLVPEEQRPVPDEIVSQSFFKIAFVPSSIPSAAREKAPKWPEVSIPSAEVVRRGYSDTWYAICRESGVGELPEGKCFKLNGGRRIKSIVYDMAQEALLGRVPTMPIPKDFVYISSLSDFDAASSTEQSSLAQERQLATSQNLKEISNNEVAQVGTSLAERKAARDAELMPPPLRAPSRAGRAGTVRKAARTISEETTAKSTSSMRIPSDEPTPALNVPKVRSAPVTNSALKELNSSSTSAYQTARSVASNEPGQEKPARASTIKRSADPTLARRPRPVKTKERPKSPEVPGPLPTLEELKASPVKRTKKKTSEPDVIEILSDAEPEQGLDGLLALPPPPQMSRKLPVPRESNSDPSILSGTDPDAVLKRLSTFRDNLASALANTLDSRTSAAEGNQLPYISRWVDYSRKHGAGWILADGTIGCILNAGSRNGISSPITHCIVRDGYKWLARVNEVHSRVSAVPLEVYEDCGDEGLKRKVYKGLGSVKEGPLKEEADRKRILGILWWKFGRYMCSTLDGEAAAAEPLTRSENFVRFFQRIGNVGIWAYADGTLQVSLLLLLTYL